MKYSFSAYGHPNILGTHKTTIEFTKDTEVTLKGDCIIGVNANFDAKKLRKLAKGFNSILITLKVDSVDSITENITAIINPGFDDNNELVIRKTDFISSRTLGIKANKSSYELNRQLIDHLRQKETIINVEIGFLH